MSSGNWKKYVGREETLFETEKGGRILKVGVEYKSQEDGNIMWYVKTKTKSGKWARLYLKLEEMEEVGLLLLLLSKFCAPTIFMDKKSFAKIQNFKQAWENLGFGSKSE